MGSSGVKSDDLANSGTATNAAAGYRGNAAGLYGSLAPAYSAMAFSPQGYGPTELAKMNTASQQSLGGSNAGVTGQAGLQAARTRNAGGSAAVLDAASQNAMRQNSANALGTEVANANLQQQQRNEGLAGLSSLYGQNINAELGEQGISNQALSQAAQIQNPWSKFGMGVLGDVTGAALGFGDLAGTKAINNAMG
jgi:hypothetical protein